MSQRPEDCQVFCCLPLTAAAFSSDTRQGPESRFAVAHMTNRVGRSFEKNWSDSEVRDQWSALTLPGNGDIAFLQDTLEDVRKLGVKVHVDSTLEIFCSTQKSPVVTLVTHCQDGMIEFRDALYGVGDVFTNWVASATVAPADQTIDLTLCDGDVPHDAIRGELGHEPRILLTRRTAYLGFRLAAYRIAIRNLAQANASRFSDTYAAAIATLRRGNWK